MAVMACDAAALGMAVMAWTWDDATGAGMAVMIDIR